MAMKEHPELLDENMGLAPVKEAKPARPEGLSDEEDRELKSRAQALVNGLAEAEGGEELELADNLTSLGVEAQKRAGTGLELLKGRVGDALAREGSGDGISKNLVELRTTLNQINPHEVGNVGLARRVLGKIPFLGDVARKTLERIAVRYEPVSKHVSLIETRLREGRAMLLRDNVELRKLYEHVEEQQLPIQMNAYLGELVMFELSGLLERTEDLMKKERTRNVLHDVAMRVQGLRAMEEVHVQFFVSIEMTRQNNNRLGQSVERTLALSTNVVLIGLAIQMALSRQKRVMEATRGTREFLGNLIAANAASLRNHTQEIGDVYNDPIIAMDKITQAHNDLTEAMNAADRLNLEGIETARRNMAKLAQLASELEQRAIGLGERREAGALEA